MGKVEDSIDKMIANLPEKTGKSIDQWMKIVGAQKLEKHGEVVAFLKSKHGVGHGYANLIAHSVKGGGAPSHGEDPLGERGHTGADDRALSRTVDLDCPGEGGGW